MNVMEEKFIYQLEKLCRMESIKNEIDLFFVWMVVSTMVRDRKAVNEFGN